MPLKLDPQCQAAIDLAKKSLTDSAPLDAGMLLAALYHEANLNARYPALEEYLRPLVAQRKEVPDKVSPAPELRPLFQQFAERDKPVPPDELFATLINSDPGRSALIARGVPESVLANLESKPSKARTEWRASSARLTAIQALGSYVRMLTDNLRMDVSSNARLPSRHLCGPSAR